MFYAVAIVIVCLIIWLVYRNNREKTAYRAELAAARQELFDGEKFIPSREVLSIEDMVSVWIDDDSKRIAVEMPGELYLIGYDTILDYELKEDNKTIFSGRMDNALMGAAVGKMLFDNATAGAVVGAAGTEFDSEELCRSMSIMLKLDSIKHPFVNVVLLDSEVDKGSPAYRQLRELAGNFAGLLGIAKHQQADGNLPKGKVLRYGLGRVGF